MVQPKSGGNRVKTPILARLGAALAALSGRGDAAQDQPVAKAVNNWPFDRVLNLDGGTDDKVNRPFEQSVWVQRAIKEISGPVAAVELKFYDELDTEIAAAPWMAFWKKPTRHLTLADFVEALVGWIKLDGEAFIIVQPEFVAPFPDVQNKWSPVMLARPDCMKAVKDHTGELLGWEYHGQKGQRIKLSLDQVIHIKCWNPYDDIRGMSEYEAARVATEGDYLSGKFSLNMARANGDTGVVITMKQGASLDDTQQKQVRDQLRAKQSKARRGEYASIFVPADLEIQDPKVRAPDAQFVTQRLQNRHEIYIAFGVPPSMADIVASYSIGSASDWYRLIVGTCMSAAAKVEDAISQVASMQAGRPVKAKFIFDDHPVMQAVRRERIDSATKLWDRGVSWKKASDYLDLNLPAFDGDDIGYISFGLAPVSEAGDKTKLPENDPVLAEAESPLTESLRALRSVIKRRSQTPVVVACKDCCDLDFAALTLKATDSHDVKLWKSIVAKRRETIRAYESKFTALLMVARKEVLAKLEAPGLEKALTLTTKAAAADFLFDLSKFATYFKVQMRGVALNALQTAGDQMNAELKIDDPWKMPQAEAIQFVRDRENKLGGVPADVFGRIKQAIEDGLSDGDSLKKIADAVRGEFNDISAKRAKVIASTETAAAYGTARDLAMKAAGIQFKRWLVSGNSNVRTAHQMMNGAVVGIDESFTVIDPKSGDVDTVKHPADPNGAPWNVINCHCVSIAEAKQEDSTT